MSTLIERRLRPSAVPAPPLRTPYLDLDVAAAVASFHALTAALPGTSLHYAVKANPEPSLLRALQAAGGRFDVASPTEVDAALAAGAAPAHLVYSNPIKRRDDIAHAASRGVGLFVVDSPEETAKMADAAPGSAVLVRLATSGQGSDWPLSRKYGCAAGEAVALMTCAARLDLDPVGVSFHVGSQQRDPEAWGAPLRVAARVFAQARTEGLSPHLLDLGGGFPAPLDDCCPPPAAYGEAIERHLRDAFGVDRPTTIAEPGRGIVAAAGVLVAEVVAVVHRDATRWVYLDVGVFTGLVETLGEAIRYPISSDVTGPSGPCVLAGPTCDSADVLYEDSLVELPLALAEGDRLRLHAAGAYTTCYSTVGFNGFPPLATVVRG